MNKKPARRKARLYDVTYISPAQTHPRKIRVGFREAELLVTLREGRASRLEMLRRGRPRIGLNAPSTVSTLIKKGFQFSKTRVDGEDEQGNSTWWFDYGLQDRIVDIIPVERKQGAVT